ncbi:MAG TPA: chlorite dismutase family protein [Dehalococcoidia bacterium]|nr:chlorite dismutase family protein [Dehalococcoidia bacterium]
MTNPLEEPRPPGPRRPIVDLDPSGQVQQREADRQPRQFLNYAFFKLDSAFRRLPQEERAAAAEEFRVLIERWASRDDLILRTYSLVGLRGDCDFMLWRISHDVCRFQEMQAEINASRLGAYVNPAYSFLSLQKRSQYVNRIEGSGQGLELLPGQGAYLFVYPFVKTRAWYKLSPHARQGMMDEHINASLPFKGVRINTSYSYGIDDQEFVVSFDSDFPQEFVDLVGRLRHTEASLYTLRDTPMFTCTKASIEAILHQIGAS